MQQDWRQRLSTVLLQQLGMCYDSLHSVQEPAVDAREFIEALHRVASPQSSCHHKDPLICWSLQLLMGRADRWIQKDCAEVDVRMSSKHSQSTLSTSKSQRQACEDRKLQITAEAPQ